MCNQKSRLKMEIIIFCGIQASGKSSFYKDRFFNTHVRISLDLLKTRHREKSFIDLCFSTEKSFVVDNTNPRREDRERYIQQAKELKVKIIGCYFQSNLDDCLNRNSNRSGKEVIPPVGVKATYNKLETPTFEEGFDELYYVEIVNNEFGVKNWQL